MVGDTEIAIAGITIGMILGLSWNSYMMLYDTLEILVFSECHKPPSWGWFLYISAKTGYGLFWTYQVATLPLNPRGLLSIIIFLIV